MSIDMNKTLAEASLDNLHDIIVPEAIGFFPMAIGWYFIALLVLTLLFHVILQVYTQYKKNQYRREALKSLCLLKDESQVLDLMKRVALYHFGREKVASLTGDAWWEFIEEHSEVKMYTLLKNYCHQMLYVPNTIHDPKHNHALREMATVWINTHKGGDDV